jgi:hypothetical protein
MMPRLVATIVLALACCEAQAAVRYLVANMSCAEVQQALERDRAAIVYRKGKSGAVVYDRFVDGDSACPAGTAPTTEGVPVADTDDCRLTKCIDAKRFGGDN